MQEWVNLLIGQFGPWAVVCFILWWFTQHTEKQDTAHAQEVEKLTEVINNNNTLIKLVLERLGGDTDDYNH